MPKHYILIGASAASMGALHKLRQLDPHASISIFSSEKELPYNKCLLADFLAGISNQDQLNIYRYSEQVTFYLGTSILSIDPLLKMVITDKGETHSYDKLFLGMGSSPWLPPISGVHNQGVFTFHSLADTLAIKEYIAKNQCKNAVVIGAGLSGMEAADALWQQGLTVTLVETNDRVLPSLLSPDAASFLQSRIKTLGLSLLLDTSVIHIESDQDKLAGVMLQDGTIIPASLVIVATGLAPNIRLCLGAGITVGNQGVQVNQHLQTAIADIYAAGDLIAITDLLTGTTMRSCMWPDAMQQGMYAAMAMAGQPKAYQGASVIISSAFFGLKFAQAGMLADSTGIKTAQRQDFYLEIQQNQGILQGFRVLGKKHDLGMLRRLILTKQPLLDSLDHLYKL